MGDINQSIMLWAGAKKTVFEDCEKSLIQPKLLVHNFRASEEIQEVLRCFIHFVQNDANFTPIIKVSIIALFTIMIMSFLKRMILLIKSQDSSLLALKKRDLCTG